MKFMKKTNVVSKYCIGTFFVLFTICVIVLIMHITTISEKIRPVFFVILAVAFVCFAIFIFFVYAPIKYYLKRCKKYSFFQTVDTLSQINPPFSEQKAVLDIIINKLQSASEIKVANQQAEYLALQNQINPHFLYNTLEAIRNDAIAFQMDNIANTTKALAKFFRYTISESGTKFTVEDELGNINNYFAIQNYRFGNRLALNIDCSYEDHDIMDCLLPKLTLQPIVENAIQHGIETRIAGGIINIVFEVTRLKLIIHIKDNGNGMDAETLDNLNQSLNSNQECLKKPNGHKSIALQNINRRIKLLFGAEYGLKVLSIEGFGTDVIITVPRSYKK